MAKKLRYDRKRMLLANALIVAAFPFLFGAGEAKARAPLNVVQCPVGTCNPKGGPMAKDVGFCKPFNCKKGAAK
jgi:hypothetical protein